ncbi:MAG: hypothetical protein L0170_07280 [Acidobacteria bacterium]|nr:hypothetical protein [Acidobacteriota bacterium]
MKFSDYIDQVFRALWKTLVVLWMALLTYRYFKFGILEIGLLGSYSLLVSAGMIARAISKRNR